LPVVWVPDEMTAVFKRFCLAAGLEVLGVRLEADDGALCGPQDSRSGGEDRRNAGAGRSVRLACTSARAERLAALQVRTR
jgi:hypothetical protein